MILFVLSSIVSFVSSSIACSGASSIGVTEFLKDSQEMWFSSCQKSSDLGKLGD